MLFIFKINLSKVIIYILILNVLIYFECSLLYIPFWIINASWVPLSLIPSCVITIISSAFFIVDNLWATTKFVLSLLNSSKDAWISLSVTLSKADVASSKIIIGGFLRNILAIETLCFWPPDNLTPLSPI